MNRALGIYVLSCRPMHEGEPHGVMRVCNREACLAMKEMARRWKHCFGTNHRRHCYGADKFPAIVERLGDAADGSGEQCLMIARSLAVAIEPRDKGAQDI